MTERRIKKELSDLRIQMNEDNSIRNLIVDENNLFEWKLTICLADESSNNLSYDFEIVFPSNLLKANYFSPIFFLFYFISRVSI